MKGAQDCDDFFSLLSLSLSLSRARARARFLTPMRFMIRAIAFSAEPNIAVLDRVTMCNLFILDLGVQRSVAIIFMEERA